MSAPPLSGRELDLIRSVLRRHPMVSKAVLYGSRAKGTHRPESDIDLTLYGDTDPMRVEGVAAELEELPLPYRFDVNAYTAIQSAALRDHIQRVGKVVYEAAQESHPAEVRSCPAPRKGHSRGLKRSSGRCTRFSDENRLFGGRTG